MRWAWSSNRRAYRTGLYAGMMALALLSACTDDAVPTTTTAAAASTTAPVIAGIDVTKEGTGQAILRVKATNPGGGSLSFAWSASQGDLSTKTGISTLWRLPSQAGSYTATVVATNAKGEKTSASQQFTVDASGQAAAVGTLQVANTPATSSVGTGQFSIPTAAGPGGAPLLVGGSDGKSGQSVGIPTPPPVQPVSTPVPIFTPAPPPLQPLATPTPGVLIPSPPPSPLPTPKPPTPEPGVPDAPPSRWVRVAPAIIPTQNELKAVHFPADAAAKFMEGWTVGDNSTVMHTTDSGKTWAFANNGIPVNQPLTQVFFTSTAKGFVATNTGRVFRTTDTGASWAEISPATGVASGLMAMTVFNERVVVISTLTGKVFRSTNANQAVNTGVTWTFQDTQPVDRVGDQTGLLNASDALPTATNISVSYHTGDGIFRLDADNPAPANVWKRLLNIAGDTGRGSAINVVSPNDIWVGTTSGALLHTADGGTNWTKMASYFNREHNGNDLFLPLSIAEKVKFLDAKFGWVKLAGSLMYDTDNGGQTWRSTQLPERINDFQVENTIDPATNQRQFIGWGAGPNGVVLRYAPQ